MVPLDVHMAAFLDDKIAQIHPQRCNQLLSKTLHSHLHPAFPKLCEMVLPDAKNSNSPKPLSNPLGLRCQALPCYSHSSRAPSLQENPICIFFSNTSDVTHSTGLHQSCGAWPGFQPNCAPIPFAGRIEKDTSLSQSLQNMLRGICIQDMFIGR